MSDATANANIKTGSRVFFLEAGQPIYGIVTELTTEGKYPVKFATVKPEGGQAARTLFLVALTLADSKKK